MPRPFDHVFELAEKATKGPWGWSGYLSAKSIHLISQVGKRYIVMAFERWGMTNAQPWFRDAENILRNVADLVVRPHENSDAFYDIDNPDARYIAAADPTTILQMRDHIEDLERQLNTVHKAVEMESTARAYQFPPPGFCAHCHRHIVSEICEACGGRFCGGVACQATHEQACIGG